MPDNLPDERLSAEVRHAAISAIKELTNNVIKHANARHLDFAISLSGNSLALKVADDGAGNLNGDASRGWRESGLLNLQHRMAKVGGELPLKKGLSAGTEANVIIPLERKRR